MNLTPREQALKARLTPEFLHMLLEAGKISGWSHDYIEVAGFIEWCYRLADADVPSATELEPYADETEIYDKLNPVGRSK